MTKLKFDRKDLASLLAKLPAEADLTFVHDQGLYIMSRAEPRPADVAADAKHWRHTVAYAKGFEPDNEKNPDWWEKASAAVGGDDFAETIGTAKEYLEILDASDGDIILSVSASSISTSYMPKRTPEQLASRIKALRDFLAKTKAADAPHPGKWSPKFKATVKRCEKELASLEKPEAAGVR